VKARSLFSCIAGEEAPEAEYQGVLKIRYEPIIGTVGTVHAV
jgi:hypothetical protein